METDCYLWDFPRIPTNPNRPVKNPWLPGIGRSFRDAKGVEVVLLEGAEALERNEEVETEVLDLRQAGDRFFLKRIVYFLYVFFFK